MMALFVAVSWSSLGGGGGELGRRTSIFLAMKSDDS